MYTLIITASMLAYDYRGGNAVDVEHVYGFQTYQACVDAGNKVASPQSNQHTKGQALFVCVSMG